VRIASLSRAPGAAIFGAFIRPLAFSSTVPVGLGPRSKPSPSADVRCSSLWLAGANSSRDSLTLAREFCGSIKYMPYSQRQAVVRATAVVTSSRSAAVQARFSAGLGVLSAPVADALALLAQHAAPPYCRRQLDASPVARPQSAARSPRASTCRPNSCKAEIFVLRSFEGAFYASES
jgi:hypothetical protein